MSSESESGADPAAATSAGRPDGNRPGYGHGSEPTTRPRLAQPVQPPAAVPADDVRQQQVFRYGPGVPPGPGDAEVANNADQVWRTGRLPRQPGLRRRLGSALTVVLLAASGVVLYLRFHHDLRSRHAAFHVTGVRISRQVRGRCEVDVTGRIETNGSAGTVSYQWLFTPYQHPQRPRSQPVVAGQRTVYSTIPFVGIGLHGQASQKVTLQVLEPDFMYASTTVRLRC